jgi:hypothetical protein
LIIIEFPVKEPMRFLRARASSGINLQSRRFLQEFSWLNGHRETPVRRGDHSAARPLAGGIEGTVKLLAAPAGLSKVHPSVGF